MPLVDLEAVERHAFQVLLEDWEDLLRCTTIDQAMERAGVPFTHQARLRIAAHLEATRPPTMRWELPAYVLTNSEKRIARHLFARWREAEQVPAAAALAAMAGIGPAEAAAALETLVWLALLERRGEDSIPRPDAESLSGLGLHYHEVVLPERGERFNTNCVPDFFMMTHPATRERVLARVRDGDDSVASASAGMTPRMSAAIRSALADRPNRTFPVRGYEDETAILNDACAQSHSPIRVEMARGRLSGVTPESTWYLVGGG